jgi:hypothetical protein
VVVFQNILATVVLTYAGAFVVGWRLAVQGRVDVPWIVRTRLMVTHEVANQPPPHVDWDLFATDAALVEALRREGGAWGEDMLRAWGRIMVRRKWRKFAWGGARTGVWTSTSRRCRRPRTCVRKCARAGWSSGWRWRCRRR